MLKKVFILLNFGPPFEWTEKYLDHIATLAPYGWHWKILTPHGYQSKSPNVEIVPMTFAEFDARVKKTTGVTSGNFLDADGLPVKLLSDYYPAFGEMFADLLTDCDYWSITNWDVVYGRLDHFLPDEELSSYDIWSDDNHHVNSLFCFYKNDPRINALYRRVPNWQLMFEVNGRPLFGFDEIYFDPVIRHLADSGEIQFGHPPYFALHSYDRLIQHQPEPNLSIAPDGALIECFDDPHPALEHYVPWRGMFGREIFYFHFIRSKKWPTLRPYPKPLTKTYADVLPCRMTGSERMVSILDLGEMPLSGLFPESSKVEVPSGPVELMLCQDGGLVQLRQRYNPNMMYGDNYGYRSGLNGSMVRHLGEIATSLDRQCETVAGDVVLDIGSNDGTLLGSYTNRGQIFVGIDPTVSKFLKFYPPHVRAVPQFFSEEAYRRLVGATQAKVVTSVAMLYDLDRPLAFMQAVARILAEDGLWYTEQSYLPALLDQCAYDAICHEHLEYYGLTQLQWMAERAGLRIIDAQQNDTNGGSIAVTFAHLESNHQANTAVIERLLQSEQQRGLSTSDGFQAFRSAVARHRRELPALIRALRADGKTVFGYGASTKGNVLLHACGLTKDDLPCIADVNPDKHGKVTPGTHIPIVSEEEAHAQHPDYFLVLPWHFKPFIVEREQAFLNRGGRLIFPLPTICVEGP